MFKILFLVPTPPPYAGPEIANEMLLETKAIKRAQIIHISSNVRNNNTAKGKFDLSGLVVFCKKYFEVIKVLLNYKVRVFYFLLSSSKVGFLRDSIYILTAFLLNKKLVGHYRGSNFDGFYNSQSKISQRFIKFVVTKLTYIIVQGNCIKSNFKKIYPKEQLKVIYNGLALYKYEVKGKLNKRNTPFTIFFMGHLWYPKGFYDLILAYKKLHRKYLDKICLIFTGENTSCEASAIDFLTGKWQEKYLIEGKEIANQIQNFIENAKIYNAKYLGLVYGEDKKEVFRIADIFVLPSYTEGFSMACLEAMAMGLPVITTPVGAMPEVVQHGENGLITPIGDHNKLADNIELFINDCTLRKKIGKNNILYVRQNFNIEIIAQKLIRLLEDV